MRLDALLNNRSQRRAFVAKATAGSLRCARSAANVLSAELGLLDICGFDLGICNIVEHSWWNASFFVRMGLKALAR